ncbi:hypothetical protein [Spirochaeta cellobiosiphila]|uniref:hypothetical protein n=1 Tax=Spirochaeta cellobiosiphila TaxID=504483 RepID=UPI0004037430|nr:hypothetical protein [Spirochaeta cellobiosiphila]
MKLDLDKIAARLRSLEEEIIYKLINRVQYPLNLCVYTDGQSGFAPHQNESLFDLRLRYQEEMDSIFGRFLVPEERPFFNGLPKSRREFNAHNPLDLKNLNVVNLTSDLKSRYLDIVRLFCEDKDDGNYGSSVEHDIALFQAIMRRIHYGSLYVAESKYRQAPDKYKELIKQSKKQELLVLLTRQEVENSILDRIETKTKEIQKDVDNNLRNLVDPKLMRTLYEETIIPLTKEGEIIYLLQRSI